MAIPVESQLRRPAGAGRGLATALVVAVFVAGCTGSPSDAVAGSPTAASGTPSRSSGIPSSPATTSAPPAVPYFSYPVLHLPDQDVALPRTWAVRSVLWTGSEAILDVGGGDRFAVVVHADGNFEELTQVSPPLALSQDGEYLAGTEPGTSRTPDLVVVRVSTGAVVHRLPVTRQSNPQRFLGPGIEEVLVTGLEETPARVWSTATGLLSPLVLLGKKTTGVLTVSPDGDVFIVGAGAGPLMGVRRDAAAPTWTSAEEVAGPGAFSPDGTLVALPGFFGGIAFLDAKTGRLASESDEFGEGPWQITWEDEETVLAVDRNAPRDALVRCTASTGVCVSIRLDAANTEVEETPTPVLARRSTD